jgi:hypothetical protein
MADAKRSVVTREIFSGKGLGAFGRNIHSDTDTKIADPFVTGLKASSNNSACAQRLDTDGPHSFAHAYPLSIINEAPFSGVSFDAFPIPTSVENPPSKIVKKI